MPIDIHMILFLLKVIINNKKKKLAQLIPKTTKLAPFICCPTKFLNMNPFFLLFLLSSLFFISSSSKTKINSAKNNYARITVMGFVYCDICSNNTFSKHSYFLPGAGVNIACKFKASAAKTREQVWFSVNRTTNRHGVYKLEIPSVDGIDCTEAAIEASCEAKLIWSSSKSCNVPGYKSTSDQISVKSKQANLCIYTLNDMNFRPSKIDVTLCAV